MLLVQQVPGEVVDRSDGAEGHGIVPPPQQVGPEHHGQVAVGHLVHFATGRHLEARRTDGQSDNWFGKPWRGRGLGGGRGQVSKTLPAPGRR